MYVRRAGNKRKTNAFQDTFKSQTTSTLHSKLRCILISLCLFVVLSIILYQMYYINYSWRNAHGSSVPHASPMQEFMNKNAKLPQNDMVKIQSAWSINSGNKNELNYEILSKLSTSNRPKLSSLKTRYLPESDIKPDLVPYTRLSWDEECESSSFQPHDHYDYLIKPDQIDFIFPSDDKDLYAMLHSDEFLYHWDTSFLTDDFWNFVSKLSSESKDDVKELKAKYSTSPSRRTLGFSTSAAKLFDFNGLTSDYQNYAKSVESVGDDGAYWYYSKECIAHKACDVYRPYRVLHQSKIISCNEILTDILPQIYDCVSRHGKRCPNIIDSGYYRMIIRAVYPKTGEEVVLKMMKPKSIKKERDLVRHIRESILLTYLYDFEQEWIANSNVNDGEDTNLFTQSLAEGKSLKKRGFHYVEEYGHCVTPLWISVSPLYRIPLDKWISQGFAAQSTVSKLIHMTLQIAYSVELIHTIPGGPFSHTDIQPRQFLLDWNDNVFINDFNRGKFQSFYFDDEYESGKISKCWYCGHRSRGHWRAPEEPKKRPLNEKLDIFSMGLTMWALFSNDVPFRDASFDDLTFIYYDQRRIPQMTANMPPAIKDVIRLCLNFDPRLRPTATKIVNLLEDIYYEKLQIITEGFQDYTSQKLTDANMWTETNYPPKQKRKKLPPILKNDDDDDDDDDDDTET